MNKTALKHKNSKSKRRAMHVRSGIRQHSDLPRLSVTRSLKHIAAQVIDDRAGKTMASVSTTAKGVVSELSGKTKTERAAWVGAEIARKAKEAGIESVVFDRGSSKYHGRVKALADAAREGGLRF